MEGFFHTIVFDMQHKAILEQALYVSVVPRAVHPVPSSTKDSSAFK